MRAEDGMGHAFMAVGKDGPVVAVRDQTNDRIAMLYADSKMVGLKMLDADQNIRAGINMTESTSMVGLGDENGALRVSMFAGEDGPSLTLRDETGETIWSEGVPE